MYNEIAKLRQFNNERKTKIAIIEDNNKRYTKFMENKEKIGKVLMNTTTYLDVLLQIKKVTEKSVKDFSDKRLVYMEEALSEHINTIFEDRTFTPKIQKYIAYGKERADLYLIDEYGEETIPLLQQGKFMQQLINFVSSNTMLELLGGRLFFLDEAFVVSDSNNRAKIPKLFKSYIDKGFQMIMVTQNPEIFEGVPRKEIYLEYVKGKVVKVAEVDVDEDKE